MWILHTPWYLLTLEVFFILMLWEITGARRFGMNWEWINIEEQMPKEMEDVLICTDYGKRAAAFLVSGSFHDTMDPGHSYGGVTHWMCLPDPPGEVKDAKKEKE